MKTSRIFKVLFFLLISLSVVIVSCKKDEEQDSDISTITQDDSYSDAVFEDISTDVENEINKYGDSNKKSVEADSFPCMSRTWELLDQATNTRRLTLNYFDGCEGPNGNVRRGKIIVNTTGHFFQNGFKRVITFDNFYINGNKIEGTRTRENITDEGAANPKWTVTMVAGKITNSNGAYVTHEASRTITMTEGYMTPFNIFDDVYTITGSGSGMNAKGRTYSSEITTAIKIEIGCRWITEGVVKTTSLSDTAILDYGSGTCDNNATITVNDKTPKTFRLRHGR